ncbi:MAG: MarR family winged helix-turn-helix transcriptional regulator [Flavobacteriaceae bacterium]
MTDIDPDTSLGFLIGDLSRLMRHNFNRRAQMLGLSLAQARALVFLSREEGIRQVVLAEKLEIHPMTLARLLDGLQALRLITRTADPADRRAFRINLTPEGRLMIGRMWSMAAETRQETVGDIPEAAVAQAIETLRRMKHNLLLAENCGQRPGAGEKAKGKAEND